MIGKHPFIQCLKLDVCFYDSLFSNMKKPRCFPENECLCSTTFEAAGVSMPGWWEWMRTGDESDTKQATKRFLQSLCCFS